MTSYTHAAVDNLLLKLMDCGVGGVDNRNRDGTSDLVRIGQKSSCHTGVHCIMASHLACEIDRSEAAQNDGKGTIRPSKAHVNIYHKSDKPSSQSLHRVVSGAKIVGVSALTIPKSPLLVGQHFDVVIVDEAGQISQPAILGPLIAADSFVLVGDHEQLPPLVQSDSADQAGMSKHYLEFLKKLFILSFSHSQIFYFILQASVYQC